MHRFQRRSSYRETSMYSRKGFRSGAPNYSYNAKQRYRIPPCSRPYKHLRRPQFVGDGLLLIHRSAPNLKSRGPRIVLNTVRDGLSHWRGFSRSRCGTFVGSPNAIYVSFFSHTTSFHCSGHIVERAFMHTNLPCERGLHGCTSTSPGRFFIRSYLPADVLCS